MIGVINAWIREVEKSLPIYKSFQREEEMTNNEAISRLAEKKRFKEKLPPKFGGSFHLGKRGKAQSRNRVARPISSQTGKDNFLVGLDT